MIELIVICAAFLGSVLAGLFGGGAGLIFTPTIYLFLLYLNPHASHLMQTSITTMIASLMLSGALSIVKHHRYEHIDWQAVKWSAPVIVLGTILGCWVMQMISNTWLKSIFAVSTLALALRSTLILRVKLAKKTHSSNMFRYGGGLGLGFISSLSGSASFMVPYYEAVGLGIKNAIGTTTVVVWLYSLFVLGFMMYLGKDATNLAIGSVGFLNYQYLWLFVLPTIPGALLGTKLAHYLPEHQLKWAFTGLLYVIGVSMFFI